MKNQLLTSCVVLGFFISLPAFAHSGRLDSHGGHTNHKTGEYHCHLEPCITIQQEHFNKIEIYNRENKQTLPEYTRDDWDHWADNDKNCRDTRADMLIEQSEVKILFTNAKECTVYSGQWTDPYSTTTFILASDVDIDHIVPLAWAHEHGGAYWPKEKKEIFANDNENLLIVDKKQNRSKGARGLNDWLPPNEDYRCTYVSQWLRITEKYILTYTTAELIELAPILNECNIK